MQKSTQARSAVLRLPKPTAVCSAIARDVGRARAGGGWVGPVLRQAQPARATGVSAMHDAMRLHPLAPHLQHAGPGHDTEARPGLPPPLRLGARHGRMLALVSRGRVLLSCKRRWEARRGLDPRGPAQLDGLSRWQLRQQSHSHLQPHRLCSIRNARRLTPSRRRHGGAPPAGLSAGLAAELDACISFAAMRSLERGAGGRLQQTPRGNDGPGSQPVTHDQCNATSNDPIAAAAELAGAPAVSQARREPASLAAAAAAGGGGRREGARCRSTPTAHCHYIAAA